MNLWIRNLWIVSITRIVENQTSPGAYVLDWPQKQLREELMSTNNMSEANFLTNQVASISINQDMIYPIFQHWFLNK